MKKIIFSDIDRTLAIEGEVSNENKEAIKKYINLKNKFILVSGRTVSYTIALSKKINASNYVICNNGAIVYDYLNNKIIYKVTIPIGIVKRLYNLSNKYDARLIFGGIKKVFTNKIKYPDREEFISEVTNDIYEENPITQITISHKDQKVIRKVITEVKNIDEIKILNMHRSLYDNGFSDNGNIWIDITSVNVNKGLAIIKLLKYLNIKPEDTVRIGDDLNDLSMFLDKGFNVAVDNAIPDLKKKADFITKSCSENGVAFLIEKIINEVI